MTKLNLRLKKFPEYEFQIHGVLGSRWILVKKSALTGAQIVLGEGNYILTHGETPTFGGRMIEFFVGWLGEDILGSETLAVEVGSYLQDTFGEKRIGHGSS